MKYIILMFVLGMANYILSTNVIIPLLGCGSTVGESIGALALLCLAVADYKVVQYVIKNLTQTHKDENN